MAANYDMDLIRNAGRQAYYYGAARDTNPYCTGLPHHAAWLAGYDTADTDFQKWLDSFDPAGLGDCSTVFDKGAKA